MPREMAGAHSQCCFTRQRPGLQIKSWGCADSGLGWKPTRKTGQRTADNLLSTHCGLKGSSHFSRVDTTQVSTWLSTHKTQTMVLPMVVQWLRLYAPNAQGTGSIPGRETKILHALLCGAAKEGRNPDNAASNPSPSQPWFPPKCYILTVTLVLILAFPEFLFSAPQSAAGLLCPRATQP